nr:MULTISPECIES: hypothetical protein [unclassified Streptomyces]
MPERTILTPAGVFYADPRVDRGSRDDDQVLWLVCGGQQTGRRVFQVMHPARQREAMRALRCVTCNEPGARNADGMLWLLPLLAEGTGWEGVQTTVPPSCEPCADRVAERCPWMRDGYVRLRVRVAEQIGVRGTLYPRPGQPDPVRSDVLVRYDSPDARYVVARYAVRELSEATVEAIVTNPAGTACPYADAALMKGISS